MVGPVGWGERPYDRSIEGTSVARGIAYYYPEPKRLADEGGWVKSLLLFFDEIAILLPEYVRGAPRDRPPDAGRSESWPLDVTDR